jgi:hypothetical protein
MSGRDNKSRSKQSEFEGNGSWKRKRMNITRLRFFPVIFSCGFRKEQTLVNYQKMKNVEARNACKIVLIEFTEMQFALVSRKGEYFEVITAHHSLISIMYWLVSPHGRKKYVWDFSQWLLIV